MADEQSPVLCLRLGGWKAAPEHHQSSKRVLFLNTEEARHWKLRLRPFLDTVQSHETLQHEPSASVRTQLQGELAWRISFCTYRRLPGFVLEWAGGGCLWQRMERQEE
ncbi:hypothetical protein PBY51_004834 [Eleginops maclovinus]|uniref:Uncharacterized protein n=1 Tax=Eleginops maclovinus TaxID=56733 RepID=A0AAN7WYU9_ELEMC|nr:hypothetical protein PBY51_004834 [Eleginops maclovinus]